MPLVSIEGYSLYRPLMKLDIAVSVKGHDRTNRELAGYAD